MQARWATRDSPLTLGHMVGRPPGVLPGDPLEMEPVDGEGHRYREGTGPLDQRPDEELPVGESAPVDHAQEPDRPQECPDVPRPETGHAAPFWAGIAEEGLHPSVVLLRRVYRVMTCLYPLTSVSWSILGTKFIEQSVLSPKRVRAAGAPLQSLVEPGTRARSAANHRHHDPALLDQVYLAPED